MRGIEAPRATRLNTWRIARNTERVIADELARGITTVFTAETIEAPTMTVPTTTARIRSASTPAMVDGELVGSGSRAPFHEAWPTEFVVSIESRIG